METSFTPLLSLFGGSLIGLSAVLLMLTLGRIMGGFLVGIGVTFGSGCTSGHGVCGLARLSRRSIVAVFSFMLTTFATVYIVRHVLEIS